MVEHVEQENFCLRLVQNLNCFSGDIDCSPGQSRTAVRAGQSRRKRSHREVLALSDEEEEPPDDTQGGGGEGIPKISPVRKSRKIHAYRKESPVKTSPLKRTKVHYY